jgi:hypothetical protein
LIAWLVCRLIFLEYLSDGEIIKKVANGFHCVELQLVDMTPNRRDLKVFDYTDVSLQLDRGQSLDWFQLTEIMLNMA